MNKTSILRLALLVVAPTLMAPHCKGIYPNYPTNPLPPGTFRDKQASVEPKLVEATANSVLVLGISNWNVLEPCNACAGNNCSGTSYPTGWPDDIGGQHLETNGASSWKCNFNFSFLNDFLTVHADPYGTRIDHRNFGVQLAPIFYTFATYPAYLGAGVDFSSTNFKTKYQRFWDRVFPVIDQHTVHGQPPFVMIGLGNEINAYLNNTGNPSLAWSAYQNFYQDTVAHINSTNTYTGETVSMVWYSGTANGCGVGDYLQGACDYAHISPQLTFLSITDQPTYTYYPPVNLTTTTLQSRIASDFNNMAYISYLVGKYALVQETGYPTPCGAGGQPACSWCGGSGLPSCPTLCPGSANCPSSTQDVFINKVFEQWALYPDYILGVNYFSLGDRPDFMGTGFYYNTGTVKSSTSWNNFKTQMANAPN